MCVWTWTWTRTHASWSQPGTASIQKRLPFSDCRSHSHSHSHPYSHPHPILLRPCPSFLPVLHLPARAPPPCPCSTHSRTPDTSGTKHHRPGIPRPPRAHRPRMRHKEHQSHKHRRRGSAAPIGRARRNHRGAACRARPSEQNGARSAIEPGLSADIWLLVSVLSFRVYCTMCGRRPSRSSCRRSGPSSRKA